MEFRDTKSINQSSWLTSHARDKSEDGESEVYNRIV